MTRNSAGGQSGLAPLRRDSKLFYLLPKAQPVRSLDMPTRSTVELEITDTVPREQHHQADGHHIFVFCLIMMLQMMMVE